MSDNSFLFGLVLSQAIVIAILTGATLYLLAAFSAFKAIIAKTIEEMLRQDDDLTRRINQIVSAFTLMDAFGAFKGGQVPSTTPTVKKPTNPLHNFKDKHLTVVDPNKTDKKDDPK